MTPFPPREINFLLHRSGLVLGDSCVYAELVTGSFVPMSSATEEVANLYLPLSTSRYLVGNRQAVKPPATAEQLNQAAVKCSYKAFCASQNSESFFQLMTLIGQSVMPLSSEEIHRIAAEGLSDVFTDQLAKGLT